MKLLTTKLRRQLPQLYANEHLGLDALAITKFFTPAGGWTWYASEFDGSDLFFGFVIGHFPECGYFRLSELASYRGPFGSQIERDLHFKPTTLRTLQEHYTKHGYAL